MKVYVADTVGGDAWYVVARSGFEGSRAREQFANDVQAYVETMPDDEATPRHLELWEYASVEDFSASYAEESPYSATPVHFAEITYDYPGEWYLTFLPEKGADPDAA